jgi:hypothetical protein
VVWAQGFNVNHRELSLCIVHGVTLTITLIRVTLTPMCLYGIDSLIGELVFFELLRVWDKILLEFFKVRNECVYID